MISVNVFSNEKAWSKRLKKKELFFNRICKAFPKKYKFFNRKVNFTVMLSNNKGWFLITASAAGLLSQVGSATYSTTKHAVVGFSEWLSITYGEQGIGVSVLCPQGVNTPMTANMKDGGVAGINGMLEANEVAEFALDKMLQGKFLITPHEIVNKYIKIKADDPDKWIIGMRKLYNKFVSRN